MRSNKFVSNSRASAARSHVHQRALSRAVERLEPRTLFAAADLDPTFGSGGKAFMNYVGSADEYVTDVAQMPDGRLLVGGRREAATTGFAVGSGIVSRYLSDGRLDPSFGTGGRVVLSEKWHYGVSALAVFPDGSSLAAVGNPYNLFAPSQTPKFVKLTPAGAVDPSWAVPGSPEGDVAEILPLPDGSSLVVEASADNFSDLGGITKLNPDGTRDNSFGGGDGFVAFNQGSSPRAAALQSDGGILVVVNGAVTRYRPDGRLDTNFGNGGTVGVDGSLSSVTVYPDDRVVVGGHRGNQGLVARLNADGSPDVSFGSGGVLKFTVPNQYFSDVTHLLVRGDGSIFAGGEKNDIPPFTARGPYVARLTPAGQLDLAFGGDGLVEDPVPDASRTKGEAHLALVAGGRLVVALGSQAGPDRSNDFTLVSYNDDGTPDPGFGGGAAGGAPGGVVRTDFPTQLALRIGRSELQPDGKVLLTGAPVYGSSDFLLARLNADGTPDTAFGTSGDGVARAGFGAMLDLARDTAVQPDGKLVVAGVTFTPIGSYGYDHNTYLYGTGDYALARFNPDGTLDATFGSGGKVQSDFGGSEVFSLVNVQDDGKILAAGLDDTFAFTYGGPLGVVRYLPDGRLDESFGSGGRQTVNVRGDYVQVTAMLQLPDGRVAISGDLRTQANNTSRFVVMLRPDGRPDTAFGAQGNGVVLLDASASLFNLGLAAGPGGELYVAGRDANTFLVTRLTASGAVDTSFGSNGTAAVAVPTQQYRATGFLRTPSGHLLLSGSAAQTPNPRGYDFVVARLNPDGSPDAGFGNGGVRLIDLGRVFDTASDVHLAPDGRIVVTGGSSVVSIRHPDPDNLTAFDWGVVRLQGDPQMAPPVVASSAFTPSQSRQAVRLTFSEDVLGRVRVSDLVLQNLDTGQRVTPPQGATLSGDANRPTTLVLAFPASQPLPDGNYRVTLPAGSVTDGQGNAMPGDYSFDFFALAGDVNRDRAVNGSDFALLAGNFGKSGMSYAQGDLNGDGSVNGSDFALLAGSFGKTLPAPSTSAAKAAVQAPAPASADGESRRRLPPRRVLPAGGRRAVRANRS